jgi:F-type H+-transporting ATPase subunit epsilon
MSKITVEVMQPSQVKISGEYDHVIVPGVEGDFGVFQDHTPFITKVRPGILQLYNNNTVEKYAIHDGFVTVENNVVKIVCEIIERDNEIDKNRAEAAKKRAEKRLRSSESDIDFRRAELALKKALVRLKLQAR